MARRKYRRRPVRRKRRRRRGMGSVISVRRRRGLRGLGKANMKGWWKTATPMAVGGGIAAATAIALRHFVNPGAGQTQLALVKYAPIWGALAGIATSFAFAALGGPKSVGAGAISSLLVGAYGSLQDMVLKQRGALVAGALNTPLTMPANGNGGAVPNGEPVVDGTGAIVFEPTASRGYGSGMGALPANTGAIVPEYQNLGGYGETVNLGNVNPSVFGSAAF